MTTEHDSPSLSDKGVTSALVSHNEGDVASLSTHPSYRFCRTCVSVYLGGPGGSWWLETLLRLCLRSMTPT